MEDLKWKGNNIQREIKFNRYGTDDDVIYVLHIVISVMS
jgi:hypothetical protein